MTDEDSSRLAKLEAQIANLTRRVYLLESGGAAVPLPPPLNEQPANELVAEPTPEPPPPAPAKDWESTIGTNWLNRAGILLLVIGITLFLGYAMTAMGPVGRIAIGAATGFALLASGYWFQRESNFRPFSLGLLAGGFSILYATAYASHAVEASRVFDNLYIGLALQTAIALAAVWQATLLGNEKAAALAYLGAFIGLGAAPDLPIVYGGLYPLAITGLWLSHRMGWRDLPWTILFYTWICELSQGSSDWQYEFRGRPIAWLNLILFAAYEIRDRRLGWTWRNPLWIASNATLFLIVTFLDARFYTTLHNSSVLTLLAAAGIASSVARYLYGVRHEALSEALTLVCAATALMIHYSPHNPLLLLMLVLALTMGALAINRLSPTIALTVAAEGMLAILTFATYVTFDESKLTATSPFRVRLALPQTLTLIVSLFAAGRLFTRTAWPSWAALFGVALVTLVTLPKTLGTIVLSLEAIAAIAIGLYLSRRPIRLGGIALFLFSIAKVFVYDLSELDTLPRIFSFIVLGLLLIGASWAYTRYREQLQKYL